MDQATIDALFGGQAAPTPPQGGAPATSRVPVEDLFAEGSKSEPPTLANTLIQPFAGFNEGAAKFIGMPVDVVNWLGKQAGLPVSEKPFMGEDFIRERMGDVGIKPEQFPAKNLADRMLRAGGEGVSYALAPQLGVEAAALRGAGRGAQTGVARSGEAAREARLASEAGQTVKPAPVGLMSETVDNIVEIARRAGQAVKPAPGITGRETAEKVFGARTPGSLSSTMGNVGVNLGGGMGAEFAMEQVPENWKPLAGMAGGIGGAGAAQLAGAAAKTFPKMGSAAFEYMQPSWNPEAEAARQFSGKTADRRAALDAIASADRELVPGSKPTTFELTGDTGIGQQQRQAETREPGKFLERRGEQAAARQEALEGVAPSGDPMEVTALLKRQLADLEAQETAAIARAEARARQAIDKMGGNQPPEEYGRLLRQYQQEAKDAFRAVRKQVYDAVDPDGTLNVVATGVRDTAGEITKETTRPLAKAPEGDLAAILQDVANIDDVIPFSELRTLDTRVGDAVRAEMRANGETNTWRLLSQLKGSVLDAINNAVENQAKYEASAPARAAGDSIEARLRAAWGVDEAKEPLTPNMTKARAEGLNTAKAVHKDYTETFREGPVGEVLKLDKGAGSYKLGFDAQVGPKFFRAGDTGFEAAQAFLKAAGKDERAVSTMNDYIVSKAFEASRDPKTGLVDPKRFEAWKAKHENALRAFPEAQKKLATASRVSDAAAEITASSRATIETAQKSALADVVGARDPETVAKTVGGIFGKKNGSTIMRDLAQAVRGDPDAQQGLRRAVADHIRTKFLSVIEEGTSEANKINSASFQKFVRDNRRTLEQVFDRAQVNSIQALADDLHRFNRSVAGSGLSGRPTTAQDLSPTIQKGQSYWGNLVKGTGAIIAPIAGGGAGSFLGPGGALAGFTSVVAAEILAGMRAAGMQKVDDLLTEALLNPDLARKLLMAAPTKAAPGATRSVSEGIANTLITGAKQPIQGNADQEGRSLTIRGPREKRATGGAVNLMALSKAAKKRVTQVTEPLLNESDDTVAHALAVAGKNI